MPRRPSALARVGQATVGDDPAAIKCRRPDPSARARLRATAYHEAGHAVISFALDLDVDRVSIRPASDANGVCTGANVLHYATTSLRERRRIARDLIVNLYAGLHAQRLVDDNPAKHHGESDDDEAFELSRQWGVTPRGCAFIGDDLHLAHLEKLRAEAGRLVRRHRRAVADLAEALLRRKELSGEEAAVASGMAARRSCGPDRPL